MRAGRWLALVPLLLGATSVAEEWPHWLGPRSDGSSTETALTRPWPESGLHRVWTAPLGDGFASPIAVDGRVYVFHLRSGREYVSVFDAATGQPIWEQWDDGGWQGSYPGTRGTPAIDGKYLYTYGGAGDLTARMQANGLEIWRVNVLEAVGAKPLDWGVASSPLVDGDVIYVQTGQGGPIAAAVKRSSGEVLWRSEVTGSAGYAPPILVTVGGARQLILSAAQQIVALNPETGKKIWTAPFHIQIDVNASTPIFRDGALFVTAAYNAGAALLRVGPTGADVAWKTKDLQGRFNPAVYDGGYLYLNSEGVVKCVNWKTGESAWEASEQDMRVGVGGSLVRVGDKLITLSDHGTLSLLSATPSGYHRISQFSATKGTEVWATPLLYRNRIYVRGEKDLTAWEVP